MSKWNTLRIGDAVRLHSFTDPRRKTMRVSVHMLTPLRRETAALYGILPSLASRATQKYPDFTALSRQLAQLYGASLSSSVQRRGGFQILSLAVNGIASRYAFGGEDMFSQLTGLLFDVFFAPLRDGEGLFPLEGFCQEQRQLLEMKDAEFNDKASFAHRRCKELLFWGEAPGIDRYGSREDVENLDRRAVTAAWEEVLRSSQFEIFALGDCQPDAELFRERFAGLGRPQPTGPLSYREPQGVRRAVEEQPLAQAKLSMGFRVDFDPAERWVYQLMAAALGGTPSSKLFQNVREKLGLCYYCSTGFDAHSRALYVESGVEGDDLPQAEAAILEQLSALQKGELTDEELLSAKLALGDSLRGITDSLRAMESSHLGQVFSGVVCPSEEAVAQVMACTKEQVVDAARRLRLGAVYTLKGGGCHGTED